LKRKLRRDKSAFAASAEEDFERGGRTEEKRQRTGALQDASANAWWVGRKERKEMEKNIQELSEIELKALAYDALANIEFYQGNLRALNGELARRKAMQENDPGSGGPVEAARGEPRKNAKNTKEIKV